VGVAAAVGIAEGRFNAPLRGALAILFSLVVAYPGVRLRSLRELRLLLGYFRAVPPGRFRSGASLARSASGFSFFIGALRHD